MSGNLSPLVVQTAEALPLSLLVDGDIVLSETYHPGNGNLIQIDFRDVVESYLSFSFPSDDVYKQPTLARTFNAMFDGHTVSFTVVRSGKAHLNESASSFLKGNFLTWQPTTKYVTYYSPEWLTYYAVESCSIVLKAYFSGGETQQITVASLSSGNCVTVNLQYAVVCGKLSNRRPMYYDVWAQGSSGARLTYIQRYMASAPQSPDESWYLFENSLGGLDSLRAYGSLDFAPEFEHQIAQTSDGLQEYRIDTSRVYTRYTGYLNPAEAKWLQDLFSARQKYAYTHSGYYRIVFTSSDGAYSGADMPSSYSFSYRFAEDDPFLDIQRDEDLPGNIEIALPDQEAFFLPPRLAEYPKLERNDDTLLLAQQPHTQEWGTLTFASIYEAILNDLIAKLDGLDITPCQGGGTGDSLWQKITLDESGAPLPVNEQYLTPIDPIDVKVSNNFYAAGDVICMASEPAIDSAELPKAGIGLYNFGLVAFKQDGGILIDSNGLAYVDPSFAGGGGLDIEQLEQYLTTSGYLKTNDPATSLLMTGYVKAGVYSPILATDNLSVAIGKLEKHFDDYVTLATAQTITGAKIFTQDVISQGDIIAKSTSEAISDAELPIASATQLGLIKIGSGLSITADGVLSSTGGGGLTEVYWDDIKGKPSTFTPSSHTHTISQISNFPTYWDWDYISGKPSTFAPSYHTHTIANITDIGNASVLEADRLSNIRYFWGQPFNGQYDVDGSMSSVTNITMSGKLAVGVSSAQAKVHVNGDGLFTGDLICKSTSTAISDAELPIASASTLGLIKVGSGLKISNGVLSVSGGSGGGSDVRFGLYDDNYVTLHVDNSYYELSRRRHKHSVTTTGSGNAVTSISFGTDGGMTLTKGSTFSLYNHNHTVSNSGSGNAVTSISFSGGTLTATKGSTFSLNGHTHSQYITGLTRSTSGSGNVVTDVTVSGSRVTVYYGNASGSSTASSLATRVYTDGTTFSDGGSLGVYISGGNGIEGRNGASRDNLYLNYSSSSKHVKIDSNANLTCKGTIFYGNLSQDSDLRLKNVLGVLNGVLDLMSQIPVIEYQYKADENNINYYGFGAQSFIGRFRNIAALNDDHYTINTSGIVAIAFQGVKELYSLQKKTTNEIEVLKQRIALLEAENQNLWNIINEKEAA